MKKIILLASLAFSVNAFAQIPTTGLVGHFPFSGNVNDASINANNGTVYGATLTIDRFDNANSAYSFNGTNNYIEVPSSSTLQFTSNLQTISFWMKVPQIPNPVDEQAIFEKMDQHLGTDLTGNSAQGFKVNFAPNGNIYYSIKSGSSSNWGSVTIPNNIFSTNQYYNIVFTNDNDSLRSYLNGVKINSTKIPTGTTIGTNSSPFLIGKELWTSNGANMDYFNGILDDIAIYDRALTDCDIDSIYNLPNPLTTGINETENVSATFIYPNPTTGKIILNSTTADNVVILNYSGQIVKSIQNNGGQIDVSDLNNGIYLLQVKNQNSAIISIYKLVKN